MTKEEALQAMKEGKKVTHTYYTDEEYVCMKDGKIYTEDGYSHGSEFAKFWDVIQKWETGWHIFKH